MEAKTHWGEPPFSIVNHAIWPKLAPYLRLRSKRSVDVSTPRSGVIVREFLSVQIRCCHCGKTIHAVRQRQGGTVSLYLNVSCGQELRFGCSRSGDAQSEYQRIADAVKGHKNPQQPELFEEE